MFKCTDTASFAHTCVPGTGAIELKTTTPEGTASAAANETGELAKRPVAGLQKLQAPSGLMETFLHISDRLFFHPEDKTAKDQLNQFIQNFAAVEEQVFVHGKSELYGTHDEQLQQLAEWLNDPDVDLELKKLAISQLPEAADSVDFLLCGCQRSLAALKFRNLQMAKRLIKAREAEQKTAAVFFEKKIFVEALQHAQAQKVGDAIVAAQEVLKQKELYVQSRAGNPYHLTVQYLRYLRKELELPEESSEAVLDELRQVMGDEKYSRLEQMAQAKYTYELDKLEGNKIYTLITCEPRMFLSVVKTLCRISEQTLPTKDGTPCRLTEDYAVMIGMYDSERPVDLDSFMKIDLSEVHPHLQMATVIAGTGHFIAGDGTSKTDSIRLFLSMELDKCHFALSESYKYYLKELIAKTAADRPPDSSFIKWTADASLQELRRFEPFLRIKQDIALCGAKWRKLQASAGKSNDDYSGMDVQQLSQLGRLERRNCFLHFIRTYRHESIRHLLTACGADSIFNDVRACDVLHAVHQSHKSGKLTSLTFLGDQGYHPVSEDREDSQLGIIYACWAGDETIISHLLEKYRIAGKLNQLERAFNKWGRGLMHLAVSNDVKDKRNSEEKLAVVKKLYAVCPELMTVKRVQPEEGRDKYACFTGDRPLQTYVRDAASGNTAVCAELLEFLWCNSGDTGFEQTLLKSGKRGDTLMIAAESGYYFLTDALLEIYSKMRSQKALDSIKTAKALMQQRRESREEGQIIQRLIDAEESYRVRDHSGTDSGRNCVIS